MKKLTLTPVTSRRRERARLRFRAAALAVLSIQFLKAMPLSVRNVTKAPYSTRRLRVLIDSCAFGVYGHWVKRRSNQDRTALFQHNLHSMSETSQRPEKT